VCQRGGASGRLTRCERRRQRCRWRVAGRTTAAPFAADISPMKALERRPDRSRGDEFSLPGRLRLAMLAALTLIALLSAGQALFTRQHERLRHDDARIIGMASLQRTFTQAVGRQAAAATAAPDDAAAALSLEQVLAASQRDALQIEPLLLRDGAPPSALAQWHNARERLWYRSQVLLRRLQSDGEGVLEANAAVQLEAERALRAAQSLFDELQFEVQRRSVQAAAMAERGALAMLLVLLGLALGVVEPTVRAVRRHLRQQARQAADVQRLALVAERTHNVVIVTDAERRIDWVNEAFTRLTGWTLDEVRGRHPGALLQSPRTDPLTIERMRLAFERGEGLRVEVLNTGKDGRDYWLDADIQPLRDSQGRLSGFVAVESDITERVTQRMRQAALLAALPAGVLVQAADGIVREANPAAEAMLGLAREQLLGSDPLDPGWQALYEDGSELPVIERPATRTLRSGRGLRGEAMGVRAADGQVRWLLVNTEPLQDALGQPDGVVSCLADITDRRRLQDQLAHGARTDGLTGLANRSVVLQRVQRALDHARRHPGYGFAVLFMDFDRFKQVNDTLGHGAGDELLRQIALRLGDTLRPGDAVARMDSGWSTAARIGGDEFVVVLEGIRAPADALLIAERLLQTLAEPYLIDGHHVQSSASIGIVMSDPAGQASEDADTVLRDADTAMYEAKRAGRGRCVVFDRSMQDRVVRALELETDLRRALRERELFVVFQPVVTLADGSVCAVEALARWRHPERGLVPPVEFIPVAEEAGLIGALGDYVLEAACHQFADWGRTLGERRPALLAVNLSRAQLLMPGLVHSVRSVLQQTGLSPSMLQLEVTESLAAQDQTVQRTLEALKALGVRLALDDFGTGYSSLACLHQMPVDTVKIDRSFLSQVEASGYHRVVIEATLQVARTLGMTCVAEGIETEGQAALMRQLNCERGQGYLYSRPLPADELERWLVQRAGRIEAPELTA